MKYEDFRFNGDSYIGKVESLNFDKELYISPKFITFQITDACNLKCSYCYQTNKSNHAMTFEVAKNFIDNLFDGKYENYIEYSKCPALILDFIGGEPLLQIELIDKIVDYFYQKMIDTDSPWLNFTKVSLCTNGILYFDKKVQDFIKKHYRHLILTVSIDGDKELHDSCRVFADGRGSYDIAMAAAKHYALNYLKGMQYMGSKMTISQQNVMHVSRAVKSLIDVGYQSINLNCIYEDEWTEKDAFILYSALKDIGDYLLKTEKYKTTKISMLDPFCGTPKDPTDVQNWCGGNGKMLAIDYKGDLFPCLRYMESSLNNKQIPYVIGNVWDGIMSNEEEIARVNLLQAVDRKSCSSEECFNCPVAQGCAWCTAYNYECFGTPHSRSTHICIMHKATTLANAYYWNKVYRIESEEDRLRYKIYLPAEDALKIISLDEWVLLKMLESPLNFS